MKSYSIYLLGFLMLVALVEGCGEKTTRYEKVTCSDGYDSGWKHNIWMDDGVLTYYEDNSSHTYKMEGGETCTLKWKRVPR